MYEHSVTDFICNPLKMKSIFWIQSLFSREVSWKCHVRACWLIIVPIKVQSTSRSPKWSVYIHEASYIYSTVKLQKLCENILLCNRYCSSNVSYQNCLTLFQIVNKLKVENRIACLVLAPSKNHWTEQNPATEITHCHKGQKNLRSIPTIARHRSTLATERGREHPEQIL